MENIKEFTFTESGRGGKPISRHQSGKICILDYNCKMSNKVKPGETWECEIVSEEDKKIIIKPIALLLSTQHNEHVFNSKLSKLMQKYNG